MNKKKIVKLAGIGILATSLGVGLAIHDGNVDHTKEVCPITWLLNAIPFDLRVPTGVKIHQIPMMKKEYQEKGVTEPRIEYGNFTQYTHKYEYQEPILNKYGVLKAPEGFDLLYDEDGNPYCKSHSVTIEDFENTIRTTWGPITYNYGSDIPNNEHVEYLRLLK